ncbi:ABC transporter permease YtrF [Sporosarcina sp. NCCP-2716]|uniref:ABC transporter permease n=1 Tax=Sporosarcina sp. NCCP-2716 TaxID=2943679 RepID=UPI00203FE931|nr:FtsX-like permease family protein [Sporosarcina sp. NCCP-2716]GKV68339.1 ABC transporter permease YtrF [Sporosarcina sp. NCCP-2716]
MQVKDQFDFVRQHIRKNKLRVFMTVLAATMGTAFLIILASVGFGIQDTLRKEILDNRLVTQVEVYAADLNAEKAEEMKKIDHVNAVVFRQNVGTWQKSELDGFTTYSQLTVSDFKEEAKAGFALAEGRLPKNAQEVVVGHDFAASLYDESAEQTEQATAESDEETSESEPQPAYREAVIGKTFTYELGNFNEEKSFGQPIQLTIVGIAKAPAKDFIQDSRIYADAAVIPELESIYAKGMPEDNEEPLFSANLNVYADKLENVKSVTQVLKKDGYDVYSISEELDQIDVFFLALKAGLIFVGTIAILISSIGIFNTMTMAVTERTREIGVMKALGAKPKLIQRLFLLESAWIGLLGTVIAVVLSYAISMLANFVLPMIVGAALGEDGFSDLDVTFSIIPWQLVLIASAISLAVAMISGWRPARKATQIDVIDALRQEL